MNNWQQPKTCLPAWSEGDLPEPNPPSWRRWRSFIGPGIVMMGIQIGGGEWLFGPVITAKFGGGLMWLATIAIAVQVFYNMECGRYALFCGEPVFNGFMRMRPGPSFWTLFFLALSLGAIIPGLAAQAGSTMAAIYLDRLPVDTDRNLVLMFGYVCLAIVFVPILFGGKIYNMLQLIMSAKVFCVLGFCLIVGLLFVEPNHWWNVFSGFVKFGSVPSPDAAEGERLVNVFTYYFREGRWPRIGLSEIAVIGGFVGYAGGGGMGNSMYSNYVRDKGWGMGAHVGAIASAVGGKNITLSHLGTVFRVNDENLRRWKGWWKYILTDQFFIWAPGCFVGMALPALISLQFAQHSPLFEPPAAPAAVAEAEVEASSEGDPEQEASTGYKDSRWAQAVISADGMRQAPEFSPGTAQFMWIAMLIMGLMVFLPSQMSVVDDVSRRWTDVIWSANSKVRATWKEDQVKYIYYTILFSYLAWCMVSHYLFVGEYFSPWMMTLVIANLGNVALGVTAFHILWINSRWLPREIRPRWYQRLGLIACGSFYLGLAGLVFVEKQLPIIREIVTGAP